MKKVLLALTMIAGLGMANAQRTIDWSTDSFVKPDSVRSTSSGTVFPFEVVLKNMGTDTVFPGDTLFWQMLIANTAGQVQQAGGSWIAYPGSSATDPTTVYTGQLITDTIIPNDTMHLAKSISFNGLAITNSAPIKMFVGTHVVNRPKLNFEGTGTVTNNRKSKDMVWYNQQGWSVGMEKLIVSNNLNIYPNPATDKVNFDMQTEYATQISILDITGRLVEDVVVDSKHVEINTAEYTKGIYLYQIKAANGEVLGAGKFSVSK